MKIKIFDKNGEVVDTNNLTIRENKHGDILNIYGFAEYYVRSLLQMWEEKHSAVLCIDAGRGHYVFVQPLKTFLAANGLYSEVNVYGQVAGE